mgnify:CR=1 FL=1
MALKFFAAFFLAVILMGCVSQTAPVSNLEIPPSAQIKTHIVQQGETLYSIAWRYDLDVVYLARVNKIGANFRINPGQALQISLELEKNPGKVQSRKDAKAGTQTSINGKGIDKSKDFVAGGETERSNGVQTRPISETISKDFTTINWQWPVKGKIIDQFNLNKLKKGIKIKGTSRSAVRPFSSGEVVYAGEGFQGYGKLIIVKHSDALLSAYAQNESILVAEGQVVTKMQIISKLAQSGVLYFEIRQDGEPIDPISYLD